MRWRTTSPRWATDRKTRRKYDKYWPADVQMIGKEIVRFHCVYWPAFLMAAGLPLPQKIVAHGWLLFEESKMSKSRGNIVRTETILDVLGADALRYFLLREIVFGQDGSFSFDALVQRYNADLANGLGNLASRTLTMITRYFKGEVPYPSRAATRTAEESAIAETATRTIAEFQLPCSSSASFRARWKRPGAWWQRSTSTSSRLSRGRWARNRTTKAARAWPPFSTPAAEALRIVTALAHPVIPEATAKIWAQLGLGDIRKFSLSDLQWGQLQLGTKLGEVQPVFPRADKSAIERMQQMEEQGRGTTAAVEENKIDIPAPAAEHASRRNPPRPCPTARSALKISPKSNCAWAR